MNTESEILLSARKDPKFAAAARRLEAIMSELTHESADELMELLVSNFHSMPGALLIVTANRMAEDKKQLAHLCALMGEAFPEYVHDKT